MAYEPPRLRTKREEGWGYGRRFGARDLSADERSLHESVSVYRIKALIGRRYQDYHGNPVSDYCPQDGPVEILWTEWMWTKTGGGAGGNGSADGGRAGGQASGGGAGPGTGSDGSNSGGTSPSTPTRFEGTSGSQDGTDMLWDAVNNDRNSPASAFQQTPETKPLPPTSQNPPDFHDAYITGQPNWQPIHNGANSPGSTHSSNSWWGNYGSNTSGTTWTYQGGSNWGQGGWHQDAGNWSWSSYETFKRN